MLEEASLLSALFFAFRSARVAIYMSRRLSGLRRLCCCRRTATRRLSLSCHRENADRRTAREATSLHAFISSAPAEPTGAFLLESTRTRHSLKYFALTTPSLPACAKRRARPFIFGLVDASRVAGRHWLHISLLLCAACRLTRGRECVDEYYASAHIAILHAYHTPTLRVARHAALQPFHWPNINCPGIAPL